MVIVSCISTNVDNTYTMDRLICLLNKMRSNKGSPGSQNWKPHKFLGHDTQVRYSCGQ